MGDGDSISLVVILVVRDAGDRMILIVIMIIKGMVIRIITEMVVIHTIHFDDENVNTNHNRGSWR